MILIVTSPAKFRLGEIVATANAISRFAGETLEHCLNRHAQGDWGELDEEDKQCNERALTRGGGRLMSAYPISCQGKIWVITEADRSVTTLLLPEDY
jgi:hypothetical protein